MTPRPWVNFWAGLLAGLQATVTRQAAPDQTEPAWQRAARRRRRAFLLLLVAAAGCAAGTLAWAHPSANHGWASVQDALYVLLFTWVAAGFITALMGFFVQLRGDPYALSAAAASAQPLPPEARTALIMTICNEHVPTVTAGLRATCQSLIATGKAHMFDVFLLSDSTDPALQKAELDALQQLRASVGGKIRVFYRLRRRRTHRKAGNVADFCRRWGRAYRYMVVLDADSVMTGDCLVSLVRLMESQPQAGIIQTLPTACGLDTLHARAQQFASRVCGRLFAAGMQYWQLGESHYWGHNAIIRIQPFMAHCALASLPGSGGLSGGIMSHDFIEAALMRRAGYHVWLVADLEGSYEQVPSNLFEELQRDRRWCQGNLQNARLITQPGLHGVHRAMLATGAMAYASAPLWLLFILLGELGRVLDAEQPALPALWLATLGMLLTPRLLGAAAVILRGRAREHGGLPSLCASTMLELLFSTLLAPLRMIVHSLFVVAALGGLKLEWKSPLREATTVQWHEAARRFAVPGIIAALTLPLLLHTGLSAALWGLPIIAPLMLAIPVTVFSSRLQLGCWLRGQRLLLIPEEFALPGVLGLVRRYVAQPPAPALPLYLVSSSAQPDRLPPSHDADDRTGPLPAPRPVRVAL